MTTLSIILVGCLVGVIVGMMKPENPKTKKPWKPKKRLFGDAEMDYSKLHFK